MRGGSGSKCNLGIIHGIDIGQEERRMKEEFQINYILTVNMEKWQLEGEYFYNVRQALLDLERVNKAKLRDSRLYKM